VNKSIKKNAPKFFVFIAIIVVASFVYVSKIIKPKQVKSANLTNVYATLSNPRLSYKAGVTSGTSGQTLITIDGSGNPDNDTNHLFPSDQVCFTPSVLIGCTDNKYYSVATVPSTTTFNTSSALTSTLNASDFAIATQSGTLAVTFTLATDIPSDGDILITVPMADNQDGDDGFPDTSGTSTTTGGFDLGLQGVSKITTSDVSVTESCGGTFSVAAVNTGSGTTDHSFRIDNSTGSCASGQSLTITIGATGTPNHFLINPAPVTSGRVRGQGENYIINVKTRDGSDNTLDESDVIIAPVEGVLVSATVDETLTFRVCGVKGDLSTQETSCFSTPGSVCGQGTLSVASYAYAVPFGSMTSTDTFYNAAQYLKVSTNAASGYTVGVRETDQLGKDGVTCSNAGNEDYTVNCIADTVCDGTSCDHTASNVDDWETASNTGFGYSLDSVNGAPAAWEWDGTSGTCDGIGTDFCAAQFADAENSQSAVTIMSSGASVSGDDQFVCYRLSVSGMQPAGYYYNRVLYTASPKF